MSRTQPNVGVIRDPAVAVAAGKCWAARWGGGAAASAAGLKIGSFHPSTCDLCSYKPEELIEALEEFLDWSGLTAADRWSIEPPTLRSAVESFLNLSNAEQEQLVKKAQYG